MKTTIRHLDGKYVAVSPLAVMPNRIGGVAEDLTLWRKNGDIITIMPVFFTADNLEELRSDLHRQIDDMFDVAVKLL